MLQKGTLITPLPKDGSVQPLSPTRVKAEMLYNRVPFAKVLFMVCLTLGLMAFGRLVYRNLSGRPALKHEHAVWSGLLYAVTLALLFAFGLRWYVAGHVPMSNGFETMQFMALATLVVSCLTHRRFGVMLPFGLILSGFALLVSFLGQSNPQVTNLMPVLASVAQSARVGGHDGVCAVSLYDAHRHHGALPAAPGHTTHAAWAVAALPRRVLSGHRHISWCRVGQPVVGGLLELGPQGDVGTHYFYDLRHCLSQPLIALAQQAAPLSLVLHPGFPDRADDLLRRKLCAGGNAFLCGISSERCALWP